MIGTIATGLLVTLASCAPLLPAERIDNPPVIESCNRTVFTSWNESDIPTCDLDGSQTWILADEASDLYSIVDSDWQTYCQNSGGVYAINPVDPVTIYCMDVDY